MPEPAASPSNPSRLKDDDLAARINRLFAAFPNPKTGKPFTSAEAAQAITAAGTPISVHTIENLRGQSGGQSLDPSNLPRLKGDDLAARINRLFAAFPNPGTGKPFTSAEAAEAITAAGTSVSKRTIENLRGHSSQHRPIAETLEGIADLFQVDVGYLFPNSVADARLREQGEATQPQPASDAELAAVLRLFQEPERLGLWFLQEGARGDALDAELELFVALRDSDVRAVALRFKNADASTKRSIARQLGVGVKNVRRSRNSPDPGVGDGH